LVKFTYQDNLQPGILNYAFGLSERNIARLKQGEPIAVDLAAMGGTGTVLIFSGKTAQDMTRDLAEFIGPETRVWRPKKMVKFTYQDEATPDILNYAFGLSEGNIELLKEGRPIKVDLAAMGGTGTVLIFYGRTEQNMARDLAELIGPETRVSIDPRVADA
jgi:hypothetical protein